MGRSRGSPAWQPETEDDWQPYSRGRWTHTPAGLYWVARDPWGPLTYHYGSWNLHPGYGWLWFPSSIYSPSHVYWYWGPSYVGWIPRGYYQRYYGGLGFGLRYGLYGWAGGLWDPFNTWIFCPPGYLGYGRGYTYGRSLRRRHPKLARGIITTDTNGIDYRNWRDPQATQQVLLGKRRGFSESELPDVTDFVARRADLHESLQTRLTRTDAEPVIVTVAGAPTDSNRPGLVGVTAGGLRAGSTSQVTGTEQKSAQGVTLRQTAPDEIRRGPSGAVRTTIQRRRADSVSTNGVGAIRCRSRDPADGNAETRTRQYRRSEGRSRPEADRRGRRAWERAGPRGRATVQWRNDRSQPQADASAPRPRRDPRAGRGAEFPPDGDSFVQAAGSRRHTAADSHAEVDPDPHTVRTATDSHTEVHPDPHQVRTAARIHAQVHPDPHQVRTAESLKPAIDAATAHAVDAPDLVAALVITAGSQLLATVEVFRLFRTKGLIATRFAPIVAAAQR